MKNLNYFLIFIGALSALYSRAGAEQNLFILIGGIVFLSIGIYRVSKTIPSKYNDDEKNHTD